jgi:hypothetical protein
VNAAQVTQVLQIANALSVESSNHTLQVHFDIREFCSPEGKIIHQGYCDALHEEGPWEVILLGRSIVAGEARTAHELAAIIDNLGRTKAPA